MRGVYQGCVWGMCKRNACMTDVYEGVCTRDVYEGCVRGMCMRNAYEGCV